MTALMWAVKGNCRRSVQLLLDGVANTEIRDKVHNVMSCHVMSCQVMSCHVMSCHVMSYHVMSCLSLSIPNSNRLSLSRI